MTYGRPALALVMILTSLVCSVDGLLAEEGKGPVELNTILMESTFKLQGGDVLGTAFVLGRLYPREPKARYVLVTAAHVLEGMNGATATLFLRRRKGPDEWERLEWPIQIRTEGRPLWIKHPQADVAVMYVKLPEGVISKLIPTTLLVTDKTLAEMEMHPGDELSSLGYPFGFESSPAGFPILRSGKIASYPLLPTKERRAFLLDFRVFRGNSGGPVYFVQTGRTYGGTSHLDRYFQFIMGLVSEEVLVTEQIRELYGKREQNYPLGLARVVHASLILENIELLPSPETVND